MENQTIVEVFLNQTDEIVDRSRCDFGIKLCLHHIAVFHSKCNNRILCHNCIPFLFLKRFI